MAAGCDALWNFSNRNSLKDDIVGLAVRYGVTIFNSECNMIGASRAAYCIFTAKEQDIEALASGLKLNKVRSGVSVDDLVNAKGEEAKADGEIWGLENMLKPFEIFKVNDKTKIKAFFIGNRPNQLQLASGRAFGYLLLYYDKASLRACIFVCYSYG